MDPVLTSQTLVKLSRVADGDIPFGRAIERVASNKVVVFGGPTLVDDCTVAFAPQTNVTASLVAGIVGNCNKLAVASAFTTGLIATHDISLLDLSARGSIGFLFKSSIAVAAGVIQIGVSETAALGGSPVYMDIPAIAADTWYWLSIVFSGAAADRNAILSVGLNAVSDPGTVDLYIDEVRAGELFRGIAGIAGEDIAKENDKAEQYEDVNVLARGLMNGFLDAGITCEAEQILYPIPGSGKLTTTVIVMSGRSIQAAEDQATAAGTVGVII